MWEWHKISLKGIIYCAVTTNKSDIRHFSIYSYDFIYATDENTKKKENVHIIAQVHSVLWNAKRTHTNRHTFAICKRGELLKTNLTSHKKKGKRMIVRTIKFYAMNLPLNWLDTQKWWGISKGFFTDSHVPTMSFIFCFSYPTATTNEDQGKALRN